MRRCLTVVVLAVLALGCKHRAEIEHYALVDGHLVMVSRTVVEAGGGMTVKTPDGAEVSTRGALEPVKQRAAAASETIQTMGAMSNLLGWQARGQAEQEVVINTGGLPLGGS